MRDPLGGETTVTVRGKGRGGRNAEFLLSLAIALDGRADISALAADTDGIDGSEDNAGAIIGPDTLRRAASAGIDVVKRLADNDAYSVFSALGDLIVDGPDAHQCERFSGNPRAGADPVGPNPQTGAGRKRISERIPTPMKTTSTTPWAIANGGSEPSAPDLSAAVSSKRPARPARTR